MKKYFLGVAGVILGVSLSFSICFAQMAMEHDHSKHEGGHSMAAPLVSDTEKMLDSIKQGEYEFSFKLIDMKKKMPGMDMGGMTHHLMVYVGKEGSKKNITDGKVKFKIFAPNAKGTQEMMAMAMGNGYGADVNLSEAGTYEINLLFNSAGAKELVKFNYEVK